MKRGRPKKANALERTPLTIRIHKTELAALNRVAALIPVATRNGVARRALQLGLALLEKDPARIVDGK